MFTIPRDFTLIEKGTRFDSKKFHSQQCPKAPKFIEITAQATEVRQYLVKDMIQAIITGQAANIPVIFNRTQQEIDIATLPEHFAIGLLTSGTTGKPKLVFHRLDRLLPHNVKSRAREVSRWLLCYHPMSFAGLQVILQAIVCSDILVADVKASLRVKAQLAIELDINAISATPSMMRAMLMSWNDTRPPLAIISLGGEIADQQTLNAIKQAFPEAQLRHIYATTEAGVVFSVKDGLAGFPLNWLDKPINGWQISVNNTLHLNRDDIEIDTGDSVELTQDRVLFSGREDHLVNVGGVKVNLETLEQEILALEDIMDARVFAKANPITGTLVCLECCAKDETKARLALKAWSANREPAATPRIVIFREQITLSESGKKVRTRQ
ncbi:AMP-binding protein [Shewanella sp. BJSY2023SW005]|uniref:AMP-binding protein n=1 Tax=Shewanella sp. BJSY2023SW005 TaxID=3392043 RepID=UPI0039B40556